MILLRMPAPEMATGYMPIYIEWKVIWEMHPTGTPGQGRKLSHHNRGGVEFNLGNIIIGTIIHLHVT